MKEGCNINIWSSDASIAAHVLWDISATVRVWLCLPFMNSPFSILVRGHCVEWFICIALLVVSSFTLETGLCVCYMFCLHCINLFLILVGITYKCLILIGQTHTQDSHAYSLLGVCSVLTSAYIFT